MQLEKRHRTIKSRKGMQQHLRDLLCCEDIIVGITVVYVSYEECISNSVSMSRLAMHGLTRNLHIVLFTPARPSQVLFVVGGVIATTRAEEMKKPLAVCLQECWMHYSLCIAMLSAPTVQCELQKEECVVECLRRHHHFKKKRCPYKPTQAPTFAPDRYDD